MGNSTLLDIVAASIIGGLVLLGIISFNKSSSEKMSEFRGEVISQQNLVSLVELIEHDFARIGYCENVDSILAPEDMIIAADSTSITFWTDLPLSKTNFRGDGIKDKLTYELGGLVTETTNPNDRLLYRYKAGTVKDASNLGVTVFRLHYFDNLNNELTTPINTKKINRIKIELKIEDLYGYDTENPNKTYSEKYPTILWREIKVAVKNLNR